MENFRFWDALATLRLVKQQQRDAALVSVRVFRKARHIWDNGCSVFVFLGDDVVENRGAVALCHTVDFR